MFGIVHRDSIGSIISILFNQFIDLTSVITITLRFLSLTEDDMTLVRLLNPHFHI